MELDDLKKRNDEEEEFTSYRIEEERTLDRSD